MSLSDWMSLIVLIAGAVFFLGFWIGVIYLAAKAAADLLLKRRP